MPADPQKPNTPDASASPTSQGNSNDNRQKNIDAAKKRSLSNL